MTFPAYDGSQGPYTYLCGPTLGLRGTDNETFVLTRFVELATSQPVANPLDVKCT